MLTEILPESIHDEQILALCAALDVQLNKLQADSICVLHLPRLDDLSGKILDLLADQLHVDFYEPIPLSDEIKKNLIRDSIAWHRMKGTPAAVEKVCTDFNHPCTLSEWFDDGDPPGWFRLSTDAFNNSENLDGWLRAVLIAKNVRSWCKIRFSQYDHISSSYVGIADAAGGFISVGIAPFVNTSSAAQVGVGINTFIGGVVSVGRVAD